jgi:hypothetical protein
MAKIGMLFRRKPQLKVDAADMRIAVSNDWTFIAMGSGRRVGHAYCSLVEGRLKLSDIHVEHRLIQRESRWSALCSFLGKPTHEASINLRGRGIGTILLNRVISDARRARVKSIWGSVSLDDIETTPALLAWYQKRGFQIHEPDHECLDRAGKKIVMKLVYH